MDFGFHNASFEYADDPADRPLVESLVDRAQLVEDAGFAWFTLMDHSGSWSGPASLRRTSWSATRA